MNPAFPKLSKTSHIYLFLSPFAVVAAIFLANPIHARAGDTPAAFETFTVGAQFVSGSGSGSFGDVWDPSNGGLLVIESPFYLGTAEIGVHTFVNNNLTSGVPPFRSVNVFLGWGFEWALPLRLGWFTGVRAGGFYMNFDDNDVADEVKTESELAFAADTALRYSLGERWSVLVSAQYLRVFTYRRIEYGFVGVGVSRTFAMPQGLREFLE